MLRDIADLALVLGVKPMPIPASALGAMPSREVTMAVLLTAWFAVVLLYALRGCA